MLEWFDSAPSRYWAFAWSAFGLMLVPAILPALSELLPFLNRRLNRRWFSSSGFTLLLVIAFLAFRWPLFFVGHELNPDESQMIAGAITLQHDPVFWRSVNGTTHGPLSDYPLLLGRLWSAWPGYGTARVIGSLLMLGAVLSIYALLRRYAGDAIARVGALPPFCFFAFNTYWDLVHYSSEHVPVALLGLGTATLAGLLTGEPRPRDAWRRYLGAVALGAVPFAKLQATPIAVAVWFFVAVLDQFTSTPMSWKSRGQRLALLLLGATTIPFVFVLIAAVTGTLDYAWRAYVVQNIIYSGTRHHSHPYMLATFWSYVRIAEGLFPYIAGCAAFAAATAIRLPDFPRDLRRLTLLAALVALTSLAAVLYPGRQYGHYLLLLAAPAGLLAASLLAGWWRLETSVRPTRMAWAVASLFLAVGVASQVIARTRHAHPHVGSLVASRETARSNPVVQTIHRYAQPGEPLATWGWMARYYVLSGLRQATREAHSHHQIEYSPQLEYFRADYLTRLSRTRPPVFLDVVGPGNFIFDNRTHAHETWLELAAFIAEHYTFVEEVAGARIYVLNERLNLRREEATPNAIGSATTR